MKTISLKQTIRTQCVTTPLSFSAVSAMLMSEDLYLDHSQDASSSTILLAHNPSPVPQAPTMISQTSTSQNPQGGSNSFQYLVQFGTQAPQFGPSSSQMPHFQSGFRPHNFGGHNGNRFTRTHTRPRGGPFMPRNVFPMDFRFPLGSCQICGRFNHQASTCYYRQNLGYRPPSFGYNSQFPFKDRDIHLLDHHRDTIFHKVRGSHKDFLLVKGLILLDHTL